MSHAKLVLPVAEQAAPHRVAAPPIPAALAAIDAVGARGCKLAYARIISIVKGRASLDIPTHPGRIS